VIWAVPWSFARLLYVLILSADTRQNLTDKMAVEASGRPTFPEMPGSDVRHIPPNDPADVLSLHAFGTKLKHGGVLACHTLGKRRQSGPSWYLLVYCWPTEDDVPLDHQRRVIMVGRAYPCVVMRCPPSWSEQDVPGHHPDDVPSNDVLYRSQSAQGILQHPALLRLQQSEIKHRKSEAM
jgi:hypothetical protein